jgi:hypothetical protein
MMRVAVSPGCSGAPCRSWAVILFHDAFSGDDRQNLLAWAPPANVSFDVAEDAILRADPYGDRLNLVLLPRFWLTQVPYRRSPETRAEMADGPEGWIRWDLAELLDLQGAGPRRAPAK